MLRLHVAGSVVFCLLTAASASAQKVDGKGAPYRKWDVQAGVGFHVSVKEDRTIGTDHSWYGGWLPAAAGTLEVGRYWTSHLKTEMGVVFLNSHEDGGQETVVVPTGQTAYTFVTSTVRQTQLVFAGTHQFGENDFVHPYLTVGARVGLFDIHSIRAQSAYVYANNVSKYYEIPTLEKDLAGVLVRPYVALGSKSYFSERSFVKPEVMLAFNHRGLGQYSLRLAFGVDF